MENVENNDWIGEYGPFWKPVYNILKKITGFTVPFLDFLSPTFLLFPLVPFSTQESINYEENICDMCGECTTSYICVSLDTELHKIGDVQLENKIIEIENKLRQISIELISSINTRDNLSIKIDHLHNQLMAINDPPESLVSMASEVVRNSFTPEVVKDLKQIIEVKNIEKKDGDIKQTFEDLSKVDQNLEADKHFHTEDDEISHDITDSIKEAQNIEADKSLLSEDNEVTRDIIDNIKESESK